MSSHAGWQTALIIALSFSAPVWNPDDPPDDNMDGYHFWLTKLNQFNGDFIAAEMVKAFIVSQEYRRHSG